jgi:glucose/arabinose dehydrogenase/outer membrane protein assembly factor BamB
MRGSGTLQRDLLGVSAALAIAVSARDAGAAVPADFSDSLVTSVPVPTALAFTPDGRLLITQQSGALRVYQAGTLLSTPALTIPSSRICSNSERGLLGVAVDPGFGSTRHVFLYYTFNKFGACPSNTSASPVNRVSRFTLPDTNVIDPASEVVLVDNMPSPNGNHNGGDLQFGKDGHLYVSVGDGGCDYAGDSGCAGSNNAARDQHVLTGKVLRITKDGGIPADNPFRGADSARCNVEGRTDPGKKCQETFAWGLRNPFRIAFDPGALGTRFFINDVGQNAWEEIDLATAGADYGWNVREGACATGSTTNCGPAPAGMTNPIFSYGRSGGCGSITGGAFVPTGAWPAAFDGAYLFSDYNCGRVFRLSASAPYTSSDFATNLGSSSAVHLMFGPHPSGQALYYTTYAGGGQVRAIVYTGAGNRAPTAVADASPRSGPQPLLVTFDATGSSDPDGDALTYLWTFGDGSADVTTTDLAIMHTYTTAGSFSAVLRARDPSGALSDPVGLEITAGNGLPAPSILVPAVTDLFRVGQSISLTGTAVDPDEGTLADSALSWTVIQHHGAHTHPFLGPVSGNGVPLTAPAPEDLAAATNSFLEVRLTATDSLGASVTVSQELHPRLVPVTLETVPAGLQVTVNGTAVTGPTTLASWDNYALDVSAPAQASGGQTWVLSTWSDGGAAAHTIATPAAAATYTAAFVPLSDPSAAVRVFTVTSTSGTNTLEWLNPTLAAYVTTRIVFKTEAFPTGVSDGTELALPGGTRGARGTFVHSGLTPGVTYYYSAFVEIGAASTSAPRSARGRSPAALDPVPWTYSTGAAALAPPGVNQLLYAVSNDRVLHAMVPGATGGLWPAGWAPLPLSEPSQGRPIVSAVAVGGAARVAFLGGQDGRVHAVNAITGAPLWSSPLLGPAGTRVQAAPSAMFTAFGGAHDLVMAGTSNSAGASSVFGLRLADGTIAWEFTNALGQGGDGGAMGVVGSQATVDYATRRLYFASRAGGSANTVWCVEFTGATASLRWAQPLGDADGSPVLRAGRVYVGTNAGAVHALDADTGAVAWSFVPQPLDGPVKGFVWPVRGSARLYFTTTSRVWAIDDAGASASEVWAAPLAVDSPSMPLFSGSRLYVGSGDGRLYEIDAAGAARFLVIGDGAAAVGSGVLDFVNNFIYVGTASGEIHAVPVPLP